MKESSGEQKSEATGSGAHDRKMTKRESNGAGGKAKKNNKTGFIGPEISRQDNSN